MGERTGERENETYASTSTTQTDDNPRTHLDDLYVLRILWAHHRFRAADSVRAAKPGGTPLNKGAAPGGYHFSCFLCFNKETGCVCLTCVYT